MKPWKNCDVKSLAKRFAAVTRSQRHIDDVVVFAALRPLARTWKERHLVSRTIHHRPIAPEDLLGAIAVMGIEIDNRHAFGAIASLRMTDRNGCIVEKAKAHALRWPGMMAWWTHDAERVSRLTLHNQIHRIQTRAGGMQSNLERPPVDIGVAGAERMSTAQHIPASYSDVLPRMTKRDLVFGRGARRNGTQPELAQAAYGGVPARGLLGMPGARIVLFSDGIGQKCSAQFRSPG